MDYLNFRSTNKKNLSEFNLEEIRGFMIDRMTQIESQIDMVITEYFKPDRKNEFKRIVLNSSIISIGAKAKILNNIKSFDKKIINKIQEISSIRNAFAHLPLFENVAVNIIEDKEGNHEDTVINVTTQIEVMNSIGELKVKNAQHQALEFLSLNKEIREYLNKYCHS